MGSATLSLPLPAQVARLLPRTALSAASRLRFAWQQSRSSSRHEAALRALRHKSKLRVAFLLVHESVWKCEQLYRLMEADGRFEPVIVACPLLSQGPTGIRAHMERCAEHFEATGHRVLRTFDATSGRWIDLKQTLSPDIVFFTNPWAITRPEYLIDHFADTLSCYVPYGFKCSHLHGAHYNQRTQNFAWKVFLETGVHQQLAREHARNRGRNAVVTGAPGMDALLDTQAQPREVWKPQPRRVMRIIWAPHHTIPGQGSNLDYSTFLDCCDFMLDLVRRRREDLQVAFKPHPLLRGKLSRPDAWGAARTDAYYAAWDQLPNGQLEQADYIDLFRGSDAMVHDSASFIVEYLVTGKPVLFMVGDPDMPTRLNAAGRSAFDAHHHGHSGPDIEAFIDQVVIAGCDDRLAQRQAVVDDLIRPPNGRSASQNIYDHLCAAVFEGRL